jgi:cytochrome c biogenesis protein CcmG/thiol:disulfide interchange protein DsbE
VTVKRGIWLVAAALLTAALAAGLLVRADEPATESAGGRAAPQFALADVNDPAVQVTLPEGKPAVLYFFASWCVPCREELPVVEAASKARTDVAFVGVDHLDHRDDAREFMQRYGLSLRAGHDPSGSVALKYRLRGLPATVFIGTDGDIVSTLHGQLDRETLDERIDALVLHDSEN